jgi:tripartite-type tricarboxylate transporter receptor subunit TctC
MNKGERRAKRICEALFCGVLLAALMVSVSFAAEDPAKFPSKPITMIIQFGPGGVTDLTGRKLAELAGKTLGQPIVVENKPGGTGVTAFSAVAKASPDGYTIGTSAPPAVILPHLRSVPFNPKEDFTWVMQYMDYVFGFGVLADSRWKTLKDFLEEARKTPGKLTVTYQGAKSITHIILEQLTTSEKVKIGYVTNSGGGELISLLLGKHVDAFLASEVVHIGTGKARGLAVLSDGRYNLMPDVPTFAELGYKVEAPTWSGIFAPKGVDPRILKKLTDALKKAYDDPSFKELCTTLMIRPKFRDSDAFKKLAFEDFDRQAIILKNIGFTN